MGFGNESGSHLHRGDAGSQGGERWEVLEQAVLGWPRTLISLTFVLGLGFHTRHHVLSQLVL